MSAGARSRPRLAERFLVVAPDLRGYGDSAGPEPDPENRRYAKRAMARDIAAVLDALGAGRAAIVGHDRGGRVAYRFALDFPDRIDRLAVLDMVPTAEMWERMDVAAFIAGYHWQFLAQPGGLPERMIGRGPDDYLEHTLRSWALSDDCFEEAAMAEYRRCFRRPSVVAACCADYRAGATVDWETDRADRAAGRRIACPTLALWGGGRAGARRVRQHGGLAGLVRGRGRGRAARLRPFPPGGGPGRGPGRAPPLPRRRRRPLAPASGSGAACPVPPASARTPATARPAGRAGPNRTESRPCPIPPRAPERAPAPAGTETDFDVVVVGAGFAGMYMLHRLRGLGFAAVALEAGGGSAAPGTGTAIRARAATWRACSTPTSSTRSWSATGPGPRKYSPQPEILAYANHVADRYDLRRDIRFHTRATRAAFDEARGRWTVETGDGGAVSARHVVMATGCLSLSNTPAFEGIESYRGATYHTGRWPPGRRRFYRAARRRDRHRLLGDPVDPGNRPSGGVAHGVPAHRQLHHPRAQRAALGGVRRGREGGLPRTARPRPLAADGLRHRLQFRFGAGEAEEAYRAEYGRRWEKGGVEFLGAYGDLLVDARANKTAADFVKDRIRETVADPETAELLCPTNIIGCKRLCVDTDYYATYNLPHVRLVDVSKVPIARLTPAGLRHGGAEHEFDAIVFATGFDAMTGALFDIDIRGRGGAALREKWDGGPATYLGLATAGFPNLFTVTGPGSPSVLTNMLPSIEQHVDWIADCLAWMRDGGHATIDAEPEAEAAWGRHVNEVAAASLRSTCASWYVGANVPGKPRVFMPYIGGFPRYVAKCEEVAANGYEGFAVA